MNRKRCLFLLFFTGVCGILAIAGLILLDPAHVLPAQSHPLPDGTLLMVKRLTRGSQNRLVEGNLPQRIAGRFLPDAWARKIGANITTAPLSTRQPVLWLERRWPTNAMAPTARNPFGLIVTPPVTGFAGRMRVGNYWFKVAITDDSGTRFNAPVLTFQKSATCDLVPVILNGLPTDQPTLRLAIEPTDGWRLSQRTSFEIPNPSFRKQRKWRPAQYPITVEQDELTFRLHHFGPQESVMQRDPFFPDTDLSCEILDRTVPANRWRVAGLRIINEAGDESTCTLRCYKTRACHSSYFIPGTLSTNVAWKLQFELENTTVSSNELHTFRAVPVSTKTAAPAEILRTRLQRFTLVVSNQLSPARLAATAGLPVSVTGPSSPARFIATLEPSDDRFQLRLIEVMTSDGRTLKHGVSNPGASGEPKLEFYLPALPPTTTTLDLVFALTRKRVIEVVAQPTAAPRYR